LPPPDRTISGYRVYDTDALDRLAFIRHAQAAALTLRQIRTVLAVRDRGDAPCEHVTAMVTARIADVEARMADLRRTRRHLLELARRAETLDPRDCRGYCEILRQ
jgi:DNA-binding transcriptional MerR regulator